MTDKRVIAAHALIIVIWASAFAGIRVGLEGYSPAHLSLLRLLVGSAALVLFALIKRIRLPDVKDIPVILLLGGLGFAVYHTSLNYGEQTVSAGVASLVVSTAPIFSALLALLFYRERFGTRGWIGSVIGLAGVLLVSFGTDAGLTLTSGAWLILLAALAESFYFVFQKSYLEKYGFLAFTTYTIWAGTLWMLFFLPGLVQEMIAAPVEATLSVLYLGLFPTVLPYFALAYITSRVGASEATSSLYLTPVLAFVIAWFWLGEVPTVLAIVGGGVTLAGVLLANSSSTATEKAQESGI